MEVLIKTCLMPLAIKTQNDSFACVRELKQEMHDDLKYVGSFEKEINDLESDKAEFLNMYDILLQECVSNDVMCSYLHSLSDLDAHSELQCLYLHKVKECECLAQKLSKQTESVRKEVYNELLRSFAKLEKNSISLELALQQCQEQMKYGHSLQRKSAQNGLLKERDNILKYKFDIYNCKTRDIAISELKKLIEKNKDKGVFCDTIVEKQYSILEKTAFATNQKSTSDKRQHLPEDKALNTKPSVQQSAILPNTANGNKPKLRNFNQQPRNWPPSMSSHVSNKTVNTAEPPRNLKTFLKSKRLGMSYNSKTKKCIYNENHDECILKYLSKVNSRASAQKKDAHSHKTTK
ncbi:hypothetical protein Tco_1352006 [Tanacetum coccineum]